MRFRTTGVDGVTDTGVVGDDIPVEVAGVVTGVSMISPVELVGVITTPVNVGLFTGVIFVHRSASVPQETRVTSEAIIINGRTVFFIQRIL